MYDYKNIKNINMKFNIMQIHIYMNFFSYIYSKYIYSNQKLLIFKNYFSIYR